MRLSYSEPSAYIWEDEDGAVHKVHQGEGVEQGDALMPLLFSVGQHAALEATQRSPRQDERLFAFLDDIYLAPSQRGSVTCIIWWSVSCGFTQRSESILAKPTCGTDRDVCLPHVMSCRGGQFFKIPRRRCGRGHLSRRKTRASKFWDVRWVMRIS